MISISLIRIWIQAKQRCPATGIADHIAAVEFVDLFRLQEGLFFPLLNRHFQLVTDHRINQKTDLEFRVFAASPVRTNLGN